MEIRNFRPGDEINILKLFEKVFRRPMSHKYWKWRFENNPAGKHLIKLMWDNETLVGHYAVSPNFLTINGEIIPAALSMTTMTDPDYGGKGIFGKLAESLYDSIYNEKGIQVVWGFPNNNSHYGFIKKMSWKNVGVCHEIGISSESLLKYDSGKVKEVFEFTAEHLNFLRLNNKDFSVSVHKNIEYLQWRYLDHPTQKYKIFHIYQEGEMLGFMITKLYRKSNNEWSVNVLEFAAKQDINIIGTLLQKGIQSYDKQIQGITSWLNLFDEKYPLFEKLGFKPTGEMTYLGFRDFSNDLEELNFLKNWTYSFGDSDVY